MEKRDIFNIFKYNKSKSNTPTTATSTPENYQNISDNPTTSSASNDIVLTSETAINNNVSYSEDIFNDDLGDLVSGPSRPIQKVDIKLHLVLSSQ